jgi:hypothetical protein
MESFNLRHINDMEVKEQYQIKISNRFADFINLVDDCYVDMVGFEKLLQTAQKL